MSKERELLARFIANFKRGKKIGDPMEYARCCKALSDMYGSTEDVAKKLGVGRETVRILAKLTELPYEVQDLISKKHLSLTVAFDIVPLDRTRQTEVAKAVSGLPYRDARQVIRRFSMDPDVSIESVRAEVLEGLEKREVDIVMLAFPRKIYTQLLQESQNIPLLIKQVVEEWLEKDGSLDYPTTSKEDLVSLTVRLPRATFRGLRKKSRNPANLVEKITLTWLKEKGKIK
jgi:hypothetical protein